MVQQEETRKGPWTEQEDFQLVCFVGLFGDRRWDFIAKVSGLNRTGKSCRLRWVNYLHPGLKRGKMTPQEERLVLDLHAKWGNRWSRIARKLPGRTDNEIKNYWRTHMRKKAQEKKRSPSSVTASAAATAAATDHTHTQTQSPSPSSSSSNITTVESLPFPDTTTGVESFYDTGGEKKPATTPGLPAPEYYSMDDIWKEISLPSVEVEAPMYGVVDEGAAWGGQYQDQFYCSDSLWKMDGGDDDEASYKPFVTANAKYNQFFSGFDGYGVSEALTG